MSSRLLPLTLLGRACLMLAFLLLGSLAHASAMAGSAVDALSVHHLSPAHAEHCAYPHCEGDAEPATQCCGGGPCAYIPGSPAIGTVPVEGALEHFVRVQVLMGRLPASIDRPPKAVRTKMQTTSSKQDSVENDQNDCRTLDRAACPFAGEPR